jgi:hypothetical protein
VHGLLRKAGSAEVLEADTRDVADPVIELEEIVALVFNVSDLALAARCCNAGARRGDRAVEGARLTMGVDSGPAQGAGSSPRWMRVDDPNAALWLAAPERRQWIVPFVRRERTLAEVGRELDVPLNAVLYRVGLLVGHGLLRVVGEERRRGRAMKRYAAAAEGFIVPVTRIPVATLEGLLALNEIRGQEALTRGLARAVQRLAEPDSLVLRIGVDEWGVFGAGLARDGGEFDLVEELTRESAPAVWSSWSALSLGDAEAKSLQRELVALWRRYQGGSAPTSYTLRLALVPDRKR